MLTPILYFRIGILINLAAIFGVLGQHSLQAQETTSSSSTSPQPVTPQQTIQAYQQEQQALANGLATLLASGATWQQLVAWQQQNAAAISAQQQQATAMANASASQTIPSVGQPNIPANASPTLKDFLTLQAALDNACAQIHNQILRQSAASGQTLTQAQVAQMELQEMQTFRRQHRNDLLLQAQRTQTVANASLSVPLSLPATPRIPPNASPQVAAFLTAKYQLMQSRIQLMNQNATAAPSVQEAALQQWSQQHASAIAQLQQLEQDLSSQNLSP